MRLAWVLVLVGCGRLGFETSRDGASSGDDGNGSDSDALVDGPPNNPDAMDMVVTFGENPIATFNDVTTDTFISQTNGGANFGGADNIRIERDNGERGLIRFVVTQIPTSATVLSAKISFFVDVATGGATISYHLVKEPWDEGNVDGGNGVANFTFRQTAIPWSLFGASEPASIGPALGTFPGTAMGMVVVDLPASLVQGWVMVPSANDGILLESNSDSTVRLVSSEGTANQRPVLSVTYE